MQDLYIEKRNPNNENEFLYNDKWEKATVVDESIKVKAGRQFLITLRLRGMDQ